MIIEFLKVGNMKYNYLSHMQESSESGYTPNIQVTTGSYCVTMYSTQSSGKNYPNNQSVKVVKCSENEYL